MITPEGTSISPVSKAPAPVDSVEVRLLESMPVQVQAAVKGYMPDACTTMDEVKHARNGDIFEITLTTTRPADMACADMITPFEEVVTLDAAGLKAGTYTVTANGVSTTFTLQADNVQP